MASGMVLVAPALGTPASGVMTNVTGTAASLTSGNATLAATVTITDKSDSVNYDVLFGNSTSAVYDDTGTLTYNPGTATLSATSASITYISASKVEVDATSLTIGGTAITKTIADNISATSGTNTGDETLARINALDVTELGTVTSGVWSGTALVHSAIGADAITAAKIGDNVINSEHYAAASIDNEHLADDAVDSAELASGAVDDDHLSDGVATGLAGAGTTATSGVINVIGGDGITANANDVAVTAAQTTITSVYNTALKVGSAASQEYVDFSTTDEVNTKIDNTERLSVTATGIDVTGTATVSSNLTVGGDFTVNGTTTFISSSQLDIGDNIIVLNSVSGSANAGIQVIDRVGTAHTGSLLWNAANDYWTSGISGSTHYRHPVQATAGDLTENKPVIVDGSGRIESSANITDDGSTVDFNDVDLTSLDKLEGVDTNTYIDLGGSTLIVTKGTLQPATNNGNDLGATGTRYKDLWLQGNADLEGDIDVNGTANLDNTDIDGTLDVAGVADFQSVVDAQASLTVTGSIYVSAGASVAAASASLVSFKNDSNDQLGYLASANTEAVTTGLVGYNASTGNLTISSVVDGGSF